MPSSTFAHTIATSAIDPFVIHRLVPLRIHPSPSRRARVSIPPGSEPVVRFGQPEASDQFSLGHLRQVALLLFLAAFA